VKVRKGEWRLLLFDGHGSHLIKEVVSFCQKHKIVLLCLPSHLTYILQPCDVGAFGPLAEAYRKVLFRKTKWGAGYSIDKLMFLEILREARNMSFTEHNIKSSWEKTGLFPFDPEVVIGSLPAVILQREQEEAARCRNPPKPSSRPSTSRRPAPLIIETPSDVNGVELVVKVSFKAVFDDLKTSIGPVMSALDQQFKNLETVIQKLGSSAMAAITETVFTQGVNKELIESADYQKNRKKVSNKEEDKISDARVLSVEGMDEAIRKKVEKKKEQEKWAIEKKLKALDRSWKTLYNHTLVEFRRCGPEMLQDVENIVAREERLSSPSKASKTPRRGKKKAPIASPPITYTLPQLEFPDLPMAPVKVRLTAPPLPLPPPPPSPSTAPSLSKKIIRRRKKV
jgi:hypothetical protein